MFHVALHQPRIPPNTGNIIRLCANSGCHLHLVAPHFTLDDTALRRAGLDYHEYADIKVFPDADALLSHLSGHRLIAFSTRHSIPHTDFCYRPGDCLLFGSETEGLPDPLRNTAAAQLTLPMRPHNRSLNLSNAVAIAVYEAWRQHGFTGADFLGE